MKPKDIGRSTAQHMAILRNQASILFWNGRVKTTFVRAKATSSLAEKYLTMAIKTYKDVKKVEKDVIDKKGVKSKKAVLADGPKKLAARRRLMALLYDLHEVKNKEESKKSFEKRTKNINHPLIEKIFNELAPKYAKRIEETGQGGGYTRVLRLGTRRGDDGECAIVELV
ncbi:MAG: bL17 family ribosomal protein [Christensenellaceae bacterium]|nr:bL17 family ribosomal protein [Christensenellaceae bacterium]